jgi:hypothetical protein
MAFQRNVLSLSFKMEIVCFSKTYLQEYTVSQYHHPIDFTDPLIVDARNTRYGPNMLLTYGKGMAAASSMTRSSACPSLCASVGCMY